MSNDISEFTHFIDIRGTGYPMDVVEKHIYDKAIDDNARLSAENDKLMQVDYWKERHDSQVSTIENLTKELTDLRAILQEPANLAVKRLVGERDEARKALLGDCETEHLKVEAKLKAVEAERDEAQAIASYLNDAMAKLRVKSARLVSAIKTIAESAQMPEAEVLDLALADCEDKP